LAVAFPAHVQINRCEGKTLHFEEEFPNDTKKGEEFSMSKLRGCLGFLRPWVGAATTLALVFHLLVSGLALARAVPSAGASDTFAICHGAPGDVSGGDEVPAKPLPSQAPCILCTFSHSCAVLPAVSAVVVLAAYLFLDELPVSELGVADLNVPRAAQPRGPPAPAIIAG
jgi:hypothetical protein